MLLVVDGYNVTISSWPHLELPRQRQRLVDALAELAMRTGTTVDVIFDGADTGGRIRPPPAARHRVRVSFSPEDVEADEMIVDLVEALDFSQPVVVATDDRRGQGRGVPEGRKRDFSGPAPRRPRPDAGWRHWHGHAGPLTARADRFIPVREPASFEPFCSRLNSASMSQGPENIEA